MSTYEALAGWSNTLVYSTMTVYMIAFVCYAFDMVGGSKRTVEVMGSHPAERKRDLVSAGATGRPGRITARFDGAKSGNAATNDGTAGEASEPVRRLARVATGLTALGALLHLGAVVTRGLSVTRVPWGNMYEFCLTASMLLAVVYLVVLFIRDLRFLGTFVTGFALLMLGIGMIAFYTPAAELVPALQSYWLVIHVSVATLASALLALAFALSTLQLLQTYRENRSSSVKRPPMAFLNGVPGSAELENVSYRIAAVGFVLWTFTLIAGAIWAEAAWGRYWGWDTKEVWTFVIWVVYASYLHARATRGWSSNRIAILSIVGFLCVVFNFTVVNVYFNGLHAYSGLD
ncbi:c-type cytochrome biogenesis protein CcsB [Saxibacter everestensis]|uniref:C-type cytochrome biogenesis protein CcsB n=1 Tax=Saxibacter everestensis TaxID=2909229 RepID=A0ABY8QRL4_9MICO|nr:c-type cytochrome biogenesis protein CcsB [Brevibacteriaceae bacterium ZFBP1038]